MSARTFTSSVAVAAVVLGALAVVPARASTPPPPATGAPVSVLPPSAGIFTATATLSVVPGALRLELDGVSATSDDLVGGIPSPIPGTAPIDQVTFSGLVYTASLPSCVSGLATDPACSPTVTTTFGTSQQIPAVETATPGGTLPETCGLVFHDQSAPEQLQTGTATWSLGFECINGFHQSFYGCAWSATVVADPLEISDVQQQTFTLTGTADEACSDTPMA
jgi:hypothetical protein